MRRRFMSQNSIDIISDYLTIEALDDMIDITVPKNCQYCIDGDGNWGSLSMHGTYSGLKKGQMISFRSSMNANTYTIPFKITGRCNLKGNGNSWIVADNGKYTTDLSDKVYCFAWLFQGTPIVEIDDDFLPATVLSNRCYYSMFSGCTQLVKPPKLPATTLAEACYALMFENCTSLINAPVLPATTLSDYCYEYMFQNCAALTVPPKLPATAITDGAYRYMFYNCTSLSQAPDLPATSLSSECYKSMFENCRALINAPKLPSVSVEASCYFTMFKDCRALTNPPSLPATRLSNNCYQGMFQTCTSLSKSPELPAVNLADSCYLGMFSYCTALTEAPELPSEVMQYQCYYGMFQYCTSLEVAPVLPAEHLYSSCYDYMFRGCEKLNYIKAMCLTSLGSRISEGWLEGVSSTGTFVKNKDATWDVTGVNGIPEGWTVVTDEEVQENTITFYISDEIDEPYKIICKEGMTWSEFVNSVYAQGLDVFSNFELVSYGSYYGIRVYHKLADWTMTLYNDSSFEITTKSTEQIIDGKIYYCH